MADDVKLQVGIDLEALQRSASEATGLLGKAFEKAMASGMSGQLLGNGMAPTQATGSKDNISTIVTVLERIQNTLTIGFQSLQSVSYGTPGSTAGRMAGTPLSPPGVGGGGGGGVGGRGGRHGVISSMFGAGAGSMAATADAVFAQLFKPAVKMFSGGFHDTDVAGMAAAVLQKVPVIGQIASFVHENYSDTDKFRSQQYDLFRDSGENAMRTFTDLQLKDRTQDPKTRGLVDRYGFSRAQTAGLVGSAARQDADVDTVMNLQGMFGVGSQGADTAGAMRRGGTSKKDDLETFSTMLGIAVGTSVTTGLERGRWGEMLTLWSRAAQSSIQGDLDQRNTAANIQTIQNMGGRYQGDSGAGAAADAALNSMETGGIGATISGLKDAGGSWDLFQLRKARGRNKGGLNQQHSLDWYVAHSPATKEIQRLLRSGVKKEDIPESLQAKAAGELTRLGAEGGYGVLADLVTSSGLQLASPTSDQTAEGKHLLTEGALPDKALSKPRSDAWGERLLIDDVQDSSKMLDPMTSIQRIFQSALTENLFSKAKSGEIQLSTSFGGSPQEFQSSNQTVGPYKQYLSSKFGMRDRGKGPENHPGVDLAIPPGSPVFSPCNGKIVNVWIMPSGDMVGVGLAIDPDSGGPQVRIFHLDPNTTWVTTKTRTHVKIHTYLGKTWKTNLPGGAKSHTHVGAFKGNSNKSIDPEGAIDLDSVINGMAPAPESDRGYMPGDDLMEPPPIRGGSSGGSSGPVTSPGAQSSVNVEHHVKVSVHDARVSVTRSAAKRLPSAGGQMFNKKMRG